MRELVGRIVEVHTADTIYVGRLIEIGEEEVYLQSESGWVVVLVGNVAFIREREEG